MEQKYYTKIKIEHAYNNLSEIQKTQLKALASLIMGKNANDEKIVSMFIQYYRSVDNIPITDNAYNDLFAMLW